MDDHHAVRPHATGGTEDCPSRIALLRRLQALEAEQARLRAALEALQQHDEDRRTP